MTQSSNIILTLKYLDTNFITIIQKRFNY